MYRLYLFFVCLCVLAACSPRFGEQVAKTFSQESMVDSAYVSRMVDRLVREELQRRLDVNMWTQGEIVKETLSEPDSTGAQHVTERTTATHSGRIQASASSSHTKDEKDHAQVDSSHVRASDAMEIKEEETKVTGKVDGFMPWYVYVLSLVIGFLVGMVAGMAVMYKRVLI